MKNLLLFFVSFHCLSVLSFGQTKEDLYRQALAFSDEKAYDKALVQINRALRLDSTNLDYLLLKGNTLCSLKQFENALLAYTKMIALDPKSIIAYNQRGILLNSIREQDYAIHDFTTALRFETTDSVRLTLLVNRGAAEIGKRDFKAAYADFLEAYRIDSLNIAVLNNLATVCDEVGRGNETLSYLQRIIQIDPAFIGAYGNIGFKYQEMGDYKTAIRYFNKVLSLEPNEPLAFSNRAFNRYKLGDLDGALSDVNISIRLYPGNSYAYRTRALIQLARKQRTSACKDLNEALRLGFTQMYGEEVKELQFKNCIDQKQL